MLSQGVPWGTVAWGFGSTLGVDRRVGYLHQPGEQAQHLGLQRDCGEVEPTQQIHEEQLLLHQVGAAHQTVLHLAQDAPERALPDLRQRVTWGASRGFGGKLSRCPKTPNTSTEARHVPGGPPNPAPVQTSRVMRAIAAAGRGLPVPLGSPGGCWAEPGRGGGGSPGHATQQETPRGALPSFAMSPGSTIPSPAPAAAGESNRRAAASAPTQRPLGNFAQATEGSAPDGAQSPRR